MKKLEIKKCSKCNKRLATTLFYKSNQCKICLFGYKGWGYNHQGEKNPMFGKSHSQETKDKIRTTTFKRDKSTFIKTEEARKNISLGRALWWEQHPELKIIWSENQRGEKGSNWQGGKTSLALLDRRGIKYNEWRTKIFTRDNFICKICGLKGGWNKKFKKRIILNADHIKLYSLYPNLRYEVSNGRTLCLDCHRKTESWGGLTKFKKQYA